MQSDVLNQLLASSLKVRLGLAASGFCLLFCISYYLFINPIEQQYQREQLQFDTLVSELELLIAKINHYSSEEQLTYKIEKIKLTNQSDQIHSILMLSKIISEQLRNHRLNLVDFTRQQKSDSLYLQFKIRGHYPDFIQFMNHLSQLNLNVLLTSITIIKELDSLSFSLELQYDYQSGALR